MTADNSSRAIAAAEALGLAYDVTRHGPVRSLEEAAAARGVEPRQIVKTLVSAELDGTVEFTARGSGPGTAARVVMPMGRRARVGG